MNVSNVVSPIDDVSKSRDKVLANVLFIFIPSFRADESDMWVTEINKRALKETGSIMDIGGSS